MTEWFNIKEKRPESVGTYLLYYRNSITVAMYDSWKKWASIPDLDDLDEKYITHWADIAPPECDLTDNIRKIQLVAREGMLSHLLENNAVGSCVFPTDNHKNIIALIYKETLEEMTKLGLEQV